MLADWILGELRREQQEAAASEEREPVAVGASQTESMARDIE